MPSCTAPMDYGIMPAMLAWILAVLMLVGGCAALYAYADDTFRVSLLGGGVGGITASLAILINHAERRGELATVEQGKKLAGWRRIWNVVSFLIAVVVCEITYAYVSTILAPHAYDLNESRVIVLSQILFFGKVLLCSMVYGVVFSGIRGYVSANDNAVIANYISKGGQWLLAFLGLGYSTYCAISYSNLGYLLIGAGVAVFTTGWTRRR